MTDNINPTEPTPIDPELATDPRIAAFVEALRAPATATELAGEAAMVDLMLAAIAPPTVAKDRRTMKTRYARTAAIAAAVVLSASGVAAAATGTNPLGPIVNRADNSARHLSVVHETTTPERDEAPTTTSSSQSPTSTSRTTSTSTTTTTTTTTIKSSMVAATCTDDDESNHGAKVSEVAKDKTRDGDDDHGAGVSAAAHDKDDCDKNHVEDADHDDDEQHEESTGAKTANSTDHEVERTSGSHKDDRSNRNKTD